MKNKIIPYNPKLKEYARELRKNSTLSEVLLWQEIKGRALGVQFHRQVPLLEYIVDFYCHEIQLAIEIDGNSHEFKYDYDVKRQGNLESKGVKFIRFSDLEIKQDIFRVVSALEEKVKGLSDKVGQTPLGSPRGDSFIHLDQSSKFKFPKKEKLKSKKLIEQLFKEGTTISKFPLKLIYLETSLPKDVPVQAGVAVPKKNFKSAVQRNRIKRLIREGYRLNKHLIFNNIEGNFAFLFLYLGKDIPAYNTVERSMLNIIKEFSKRTDDAKTSQ